MSQYTDANGITQPDRRQSGHLRSVFADVMRLVEPFFRRGGGLNGQCPCFWVTRAIRDAYPDMSLQDAQVLTNAAVRYYASPQKPAA